MFPTWTRNVFLFVTSVDVLWLILPWVSARSPSSLFLFSTWVSLQIEKRKKDFFTFWMWSFPIQTSLFSSFVATSFVNIFFDFLKNFFLSNTKGEKRNRKQEISRNIREKLPNIFALWNVLFLFIILQITHFFPFLFFPFHFFFSIRKRGKEKPKTGNFPKY